MNILLMTNTYKPLVGGLERSIEAFALEFRRRGHRVIIVAPQFENMEPEQDVIRVPAVQHFNGTVFSVQLPDMGMVEEALGDFKPDIVHSQHPFLVGDTALRLAYRYRVPLIFTHHTLYEQNTHYMSSDSDAMKRFVIQLSTGYANLADKVFAPSESVLQLIRERGVESPVEVVPTGIDLMRFAGGDRQRVLQRFGLPPDAFVLGHLGRLAPEKNLEFITEAAVLFLTRNKKAHFLVAGTGPSEAALETRFKEAGLFDRVRLIGSAEGPDLADAYHAMDAFAFASQSETQGLVLIEAMACGVPVVGVDASGVRDVIRDKVNGRLVQQADTNDFVAAVEWVQHRPRSEAETLRRACRMTAADFSIQKCADRALAAYGSIARDETFMPKFSEDSGWAQTMRAMHAHWDLAKNLGGAAVEAMRTEAPTG